MNYGGKKPSQAHKLPVIDVYHLSVRGTQRGIIMASLSNGQSTRLFGSKEPEDLAGTIRDELRQLKIGSPVSLGSIKFAHVSDTSRLSILTLLKKDFN